MGVVPLFTQGNPDRGAAEAPHGHSAAAVAVTSTLPATGGRRGEYAIGDLARELSMLHFSRRTIIEHLRALAKKQGMPLPRTPRIVDGKPVTGPESIYAHSRWDAGEFDAWMGGRTPGAPAAAVPRPVREEMHRRAELIAVGGRA